MGQWRTVALALPLAGSLAGLGSAFGQERPKPEEPKKGIEVKAPPPAAAPGFRFEPGQPREINRVRQEEYYPDRIRARHEPAFIEPLTTTIRTGPGSAVRAGVAGWTAPRVPHDDREATGVVAFGFSLNWGLPVPGEEEGSERRR